MGVVTQIFTELLSEKQLQLEKAKRSGKTNCFTGIYIKYCLYTHKNSFLKNLNFLLKSDGIAPP